MKFPTIFVNHGGGPLPLLGRQPSIVAHLQDIAKPWLSAETKPKAIVVFSAHWESDPIQITSSAAPSMLYDYSGFPPETYKYQYPAPGSPALASQIQNLLTDAGIASELNDTRGYDHGVFVPLMLMAPNADIPVVCVSLHSSLDAQKNMAVGAALSSLRDENVLMLGSGYTFHNMHAFFHPSETTYKASKDFNHWLKETIVGSETKQSASCPNTDAMLQQLQAWETAPGAKLSHPRAEHLIPLLVVAAAGGPNAQAQLTYETSSTATGEHAISSYLFN